MSNITKEQFTPKVKMSVSQASTIKKKLKELFNEEVWLDSKEQTLVFCLNDHMLHPYILEVLSKYKVFVQMSLI